MLLHSNFGKFGYPCATPCAIRFFWQTPSYDLCRCHTKRRIDGRGHANPSFGMTPTKDFVLSNSGFGLKMGQLLRKLRVFWTFLIKLASSKLWGTPLIGRIRYILQSVSYQKKALPVKILSTFSCGSAHFRRISLLKRFCIRPAGVTRYMDVIQRLSFPLAQALLGR